MAMKETVRSLRAYFILSGLLSLFISGSLLRVTVQAPITFLTALVTVVAIITVAFGLAFLYVGFTLATLLRTSASRIVLLLYASTVWSSFHFLLGLLRGLASSEVVTLVLTLFILWYLLKNVRRLSAEAQVSSSEAPSVGV